MGCVRGAYSPCEGASSRYYFFDIGALAELQGRQFRLDTPEFGEAFETYLMHELTCYSDYISGEPLYDWRSTSGFEIDFILGDQTAIEVNAKKEVSARDLKSIRALAEEKKLKRYLCVSLGSTRRTMENITVLPLRNFLDSLWNGEYS